MAFIEEIFEENEEYDAHASWLGLDNIRYFVIFGASYCDVGYDSSQPHPTEDRPLGVRWPGKTYTEAGTPNWIGHLVSQYLSGRPAGSGPLVFDYAAGGNQVEGVRRQIETQFLPTLGRKPDWAPWTASDTLFITWVGINDCAEATMSSVPVSVKLLLDGQEQLYEAGARNFVLIDVPPIHRLPVFANFGGGGEERAAIYAAWNKHLREAVEAFSAAHPDAWAVVFSSWDTISRVLDDPVEHGFSEEDVCLAGGAIWYDYLHPTSAVHDLIAWDLAAFLAAIPSREDRPGT
ncbi:hypothetical protein CERSUDRAFT_99099 [Gelatoporia subvermispora B]|uniref:Carbohydrate esterase family 16 protein n=1 Tax=Ceriporiopsis subvermispora (strain B) TaxID=914234 RepID=M2R3A6_CERS8|nr:hypothetical protein CERSUDRAFT_99099 [Gelatoporia subvermispora B]